MICYRVVLAKHESVVLKVLFLFREGNEFIRAVKLPPSPCHPERGASAPSRGIAPLLLIFQLIIFQIRSMIGIWLVQIMNMDVNVPHV